MDKPDADSRRDDLDQPGGEPRLTPSPDGGGETTEPMAEALDRADREARASEGTAETSARDDGVPLTESQRLTRESLAELIPTPSAEPPDHDGQKTPPIAP